MAVKKPNELREPIFDAAMELANAIERCRLDPTAHHDLHGIGNCWYARDARERLDLATKWFEVKVKKDIWMEANLVVGTWSAQTNLLKKMMTQVSYAMKELEELEERMGIDGSRS